MKKKKNYARYKILLRFANHYQCWSTKKNVNFEQRYQTQPDNDVETHIAKF